MGKDKSFTLLTWYLLNEHIVLALKYSYLPHHPRLLVVPSQGACCLESRLGLASVELSRRVHLALLAVALGVVVVGRRGVR